jgi:hypothetical protein
MSEEESNTKKRALSTLTSLDQSRGDFSAGAGAAEPPRRRQRLLTTNSSVLATLGSSTTPTFDYETEKLKTEIQDLKASLEHQRTLRTLDQRRFQQTQTRLERQLLPAADNGDDGGFAAMPRLDDEGDVVDDFAAAAVDDPEVDDVADGDGVPVAADEPVGGAFAIHEERQEEEEEAIVPARRRSPRIAAQERRNGRPNYKD